MEIAPKTSQCQRCEQDFIPIGAQKECRECIDGLLEGDAFERRDYEAWDDEDSRCQKCKSLSCYDDNCETKLEELSDHNGKPVHTSDQSLVAAPTVWDGASGFLNIMTRSDSITYHINSNPHSINLTATSDDWLKPYDDDWLKPYEDNLIQRVREAVKDEMNNDF